MIILAIINGAIREAVYTDSLGEKASHNVSVFTLIILLGIYIWFITRKWKFMSSGQAWLTGIIWVILTVLFEFVFFGFVLKISWEKLISAYNLPSGELWILVLIWILISPWIFYRLRLNKNNP